MKRILVATGLLLVAAFVFAGGGAERTSVGVEMDDTVHISPFSSPGAQDTLVVPIRVSTASGNRNVVIAYEIVVRDASDRLVWTESAVDQSEQPGFFGRLFQNLGLAQRETTVTIPESTVWNGTFQGSAIGADGVRVPDGDYTYVLTATLASEDTVASEPRTVVVDNTPPTAVAELDHLYFAPGSEIEGARQSITLTQTTSSEIEWIGRVVSATGTEVFNVTWEGEAAREFVWDGRDVAGSTVPDGTYRYTLAGRDRAGNTFSIDPIDVAVDTATRPITIASAMPAPGGFAFSPDASGVRDELLLSFGGAAVNTDRLDRVELSAEGPVSGSVDITTMATGVVSLTGYVDDARTERAPEGEYLLTVTASYLNGMVVSASQTAVLDVTPPAGRMALSGTIFSPEEPAGDGFKDAITVTHTLSNDATWVGEVYDHRTDALLESFTIDPAQHRSVVWNGRDLDGRPLPDGTYRYRVVGTDAAGNRTETEFAQVTLDRRPTDIDIVLSREYFSPNGDGQGDVVVVTPDLSVPTGVAEYRFRIVDAMSNEVLSFEGTGPLPARFPWDGRNAAGEVMPEGQYFAALDLVYEKGNHPRAVSAPMEIDNTVPQVALRLSAPALRTTAPGGDAIEFIPFVDPLDEIVSYTGQIRALDGRVVTEISGDSPRGVAYWDGSTSAGRLASDGSYVGVLSVEHRNGTIREAQTATIALSTGDDATPAVALRLMPQTFSPDGDGIADTVNVLLAVAGNRPLAKWSVRVIAPDGSVFHRVDGTDPVRSFEWDGRNAAGNRVRMATDYQVAYEATDAIGSVITGSETLTVDILTEERFGMRRILVDDVIFEGYTTRYLNWNKNLSERNVAALDQLAAALAKFPNYRVAMHGHAVSVLYYDAVRSDLEQVETLIPLSRGRTETILDALVTRGVARDRFTREWWGKLRPLIPFSDLDERFVNRRVEFYLIR